MIHINLLTGKWTNKWAIVLMGLFIIGHVTFALADKSSSVSHREDLSYVVQWKGSQAGHGGITTIHDRGGVKIEATAVTDNPIKRILEIWCRVEGAFGIKNRRLKPKRYQYRIKSNLLRNERVELTFDKKSDIVSVYKLLGDRQERHKEKVGSALDPVTAAFFIRLLAHQKKRISINIYAGRARCRLTAVPVSKERLVVRGGAFNSTKWNMTIVKLTGKKEQVATGNLWVSNDNNRIPILLISNVSVGTVRIELVKVKLS